MHSFSRLSTRHFPVISSTLQLSEYEKRLIAADSPTFLGRTDRRVSIIRFGGGTKDQALRGSEWKEKRKRESGEVL
jgi:hypothetical protein